MVVKIMESSRTMSGPLEYNDRKVSAGEASVISAVNMMEGCGIRETFTRYEHMNRRSTDVSFHMAVNPSENEKMTDEQICAFVAEMMTGLGYGQQPYVIYRHQDIDRTHWHVLSIRTDNNGKKIHDHKEQRRCQELMATLAAKYGYEIGNGKRPDGRKQIPHAVRFDPKAGNVIAQIDAIFQGCLQYRFSTFNQFRQILASYGINMTEKTGEKTTLEFQGLDAKGKPCTRVVTESMIASATYEAYAERALENARGMGVLDRERSRVGNLADMALNVSMSEKHFRNILSKQGIDAHISRSPDGRAIGVTFIDHKTRCAFKGSEIGSGDAAERIRTNEESGKWSSPADTSTAQTTHEETHKGQGTAVIGSLLEGMASTGKAQGHDPKDDKRKKKRRKGMRM